MSGFQLKNYSASVDSWINSNAYPIYCEEKKKALREIFEFSSVSMIYGPAGTGKSTFINHVSHFFSNVEKLFLANTHPAIDNLKHKVTAAKCDFTTIRKFLTNTSIKTKYDILVIDECSAVSNDDMIHILNKAEFSFLLLVGDMYQIESIRFGNWFSAVRSFLPRTSIYELTTPYRTSNSLLLKLWERVRSMDEGILELITKEGYSAKLDTSVFEPAERDEIILCLNYDGLYGINNINRFLQETNPNTSVS